MTQHMLAIVLRQSVAFSTGRSLFWNISTQSAVAPTFYVGS